jgi:hypothetical protein
MEVGFPANTRGCAERLGCGGCGVRYTILQRTIHWYVDRMAAQWDPLRRLVRLIAIDIVR